MAKGLINIEATVSGKTLVEMGLDRGSTSYISMTNAHASTVVAVGLYLEDSDGAKTYILKTDIPGKTTLFLDEGLSFNNTALALKIDVASADLDPATPLSIIIK